MSSTCVPRVSLHPACQSGSSSLTQLGLFKEGIQTSLIYFPFLT
jgi:hypothetical protein